MLAGGCKARHANHMTRCGRACDWNLDDEKHTCTEVASALVREPPSRGLTEAELAQGEARQMPRPEVTNVGIPDGRSVRGQQATEGRAQPASRAAPTGGGARSARRDGHPSRP